MFDRLDYNVLVLVNAWEHAPSYNNDNNIPCEIPQVDYGEDRMYICCCTYVENICQTGVKLCVQVTNFPHEKNHPWWSDFIDKTWYHSSTTTYFFEET